MPVSHRFCISPFHWYRLTAIPVLALLLLHFAVYKKLPFQPGYVFPWETFLILVGTGLFVCQSNCEVYRRWGSKKRLGQGNAALMFRQFAYGWLATTLVFSMAYFAQRIAFGVPIDWVKFLGYLMLMLGISSLESAVLLLRDLYGFLQTKPKVPVVDNGTAGEVFVNISSGKKLLRLQTGEVAFVHSTGGIVTFHTFHGQKITSDFNALDEVENALQQAPFFRLNRQYLVHRSAIRQIVNAENRKIQVTVQPNGKPSEQFRVPVSRYRARAFQNWFAAC